MPHLRQVKAIPGARIQRLAGTGNSMIKRDLIVKIYKSYIES